MYEPQRIDLVTNHHKIEFFMSLHQYQTPKPNNKAIFPFKT